MYQVIARKYRPQTFHDVVNQEHVKTTLENAIAQNRIAHGYIFSGQRGTGKTTIARILARCLNCINGPTATPCGECASCLEITAGGGASDVIEIDAASNRGINEMRELRENVRYQPARDRYKIFIVDEAHQITNEAFNALLKTIEEPPPWAVFVLCTTEAHKIPATIASRCQHFSFRSVDFEDLIARMAWICEQEGIEADPEALAVLAQAGEGSVRDSLSALDQAIACCGAKLNAAEVRALLGAFSLESLEKVSQALADGDSRRMLEVVDELERNGQNLQHFSRELSRYFRNLLVARIAGADTRLVAASAAQREKLVEIAAQFLRRGPDPLSAALARSVQRSAVLAAAALPPGDRARAAGAGRPAAADRAGARRDEAERAAPPRPAAAAVRARSGRRTAPPAAAAAREPSPFELDRAKKAAHASAGAAIVRRPTRSRPSRCADRRLAAAAARRADGTRHAVHRRCRRELARRRGQRRTAVHHQRSLQAGAAAGRSQQGARSRSRRSRPHQGDSRRRRAAGSAARRGAGRRTATEDEATSRALANPEVQRFREVFGGEIRKVRNLKE